jgi:phosphoglycolate phosphatase
MIYRTIIFDFDGTLADTLEETRKIYNRMAADYKLREVHEDELPQLRHLSLKDLLDHLGIPGRRVPMLLAKGTRLLRGNIASLPLIQGMGEVLPILRPRVQSFGILTSNASENVELFLEAHGIRGLFDFISSTSKLTGKSRHLRAICKTFSLRPQEMLYVGDEIRDLKASQKAGVPVAGVTWGFNSRESLSAEQPQYVLDRPEQFLEIIRTDV